MSTNAMGDKARGATYILIYTTFREETQQFQFTQCAQTEQGMLEGEHLLDRNLPSGWLV